MHIPQPSPASQAFSNHRPSRMNFQDRLKALTGLLGPWSELWSRSILQNWPESGAAYLESWLAYAESLGEEGERMLDAGELPGDPPRSLHSLVLELREPICQLGHEPLQRAFMVDRRHDHRPVLITPGDACRSPFLGPASNAQGGAR